MEIKFRIYKRLLIIFIPLIILILGLLLLTHNIDSIDDIVLKTYRTNCYECILLNMNDVNNKKFLGNISVNFNGNKISMEKTFYTLIINNTKVIHEFLEGLNWIKIIKENGFKISKVNLYILQEYLNFIHDKEVAYNDAITQSQKILDATEDLKQLLCRKYDIDIGLAVAEYIKTIDWNNYIKTHDASKKNYIIAQYYFHDFFLEYKEPKAKRISIPYEILKDVWFLFKIYATIFHLAPLSAAWLLKGVAVTPLIRYFYEQLNFNVTMLPDEFMWEFAKYIIKKGHVYDFLIDVIKMRYGTG